MKHFITILLCLQFISLVSYSQDYYWYKGNRITLKRGYSCYILRETGHSNYQNKGVVGSNIVSEYEDKDLYWDIVSSETIADTNDVLYRTPSFLFPDSIKNMYITHRFYVKLRDANDYELLQEYASIYGAEIEKNGDLPLWYILRCGLHSGYNALELANIFYESGSFVAAEPEFIGSVQTECVNDPLFTKQWNLKNTGQYTGFYDVIEDVNYCDAHAITAGDATVIIGVYDRGIDLSHPDINLHPFSYDVTTGTSPSQVYEYHGTACAGIISAKTNNIGIVGIAPECPVMSLSFSDATTTYRLGNGFKIAADNGCSVISNSWSCYSMSLYIDDGISYALSQGRDGKGCVVVFSSGNNDSDSINYPANSNDSIIVVGAMSPCGQRCNPYSCDGEINWGSNYGLSLDVMAPGVKIPTTDIAGNLGANPSDYMLYFNGTSSACPHVSAVAGLILSIYPLFTQKEVADIIESTTIKIGTGYTTSSNRPNGTWCDIYGYGLLDAYAAVVAAKNIGSKYIQDTTYVNGTTCTELAHEIYAGDAVTNERPYGSVIVQTGSNVTFKAANKIELHPGFSVESGATFNAIIGPISQQSSAPSNAHTRETMSFAKSVKNKGIIQCQEKILVLSPNPVNSILHIQSEDELLQVDIYNLDGQCVLHASQADIDVSGLPHGMYIVSATTTANELLQTKFIKQ